MTQQFELTLPNRRSAISDLQDQLESFGRQHDLAARGLHAMQLALEEHLTNLLAYGYDDQAEHWIKIRVQLLPPELRVEVADDGHPFNPLAHAAPDLAKPFEERPIGGWGIHLMRKSLDEVEYRREAGANVLLMIKRL